MGKKVLIAAFIIGFLVIPFFVHAEVYKWIDGKGTIHFTDDYSNIPSSYRERLKVEIRKDIREERPLPGTQEIIPGVKEEQSNADVYREEEVWREEKMRSWMEQLEAATANYESVQRRFMQSAEALSRRRFGSPTMYKFDIIKLDVLNQERMKYEAQFEEANEMLRKLSEFDFWGAASTIVGEGKTTDIYGIGEDWWRERVGPWKKKLEELNVRYENAEKKFMEMSEDLSKRRYGNRHTIKAKIIELDRANKEALDYRAQITENERELERISKDAEESMADPEWLK
jgi:DNA repair exonuclease SbcCD ATPase subunit